MLHYWIYLCSNIKNLIDIVLQFISQRFKENCSFYLLCIQFVEVSWLSSLDVKQNTFLLFSFPLETGKNKQSFGFFISSKPWYEVILRNASSLTQSLRLPRLTLWKLALLQLSPRHSFSPPASICLPAGSLLNVQFSPMNMF